MNPSRSMKFPKSFAKPGDWSLTVLKLKKCSSILLKIGKIQLRTTWRLSTCPLKIPLNVLWTEASSLFYRVYLLCTSNLKMLLLFNSGLTATHHDLMGNGGMLSELSFLQNATGVTSMWLLLFLEFLLWKQCFIIRFLIISQLGLKIQLCHYAFARTVVFSFGCFILYQRDKIDFCPVIRTGMRWGEGSTY